MSEIPPGPWGLAPCKDYSFTNANGDYVYSENVIACRDALTAAESRIRELEAREDWLNKLPQDRYGISPEQYHAALDKIWTALHAEGPQSEDVFAQAANRIRELEAQAETLREMTVRLGEDVMAFGDDDAPPTRAEFLLVVREVNELRATVAALMPGDAGHVG